MEPTLDPNRSGDVPRLVLLPGMDGTGVLFRPFVSSVRAAHARSPITVSYPPHVVLGYDELVPIVENALPTDEPFVLVGESFSGPLACRVAARAPRGLEGVVLVASFLRMPRRFPVFWRALAREKIFHLRPPKWAVKQALLGAGASPVLVEQVQAAVTSVAPRVLLSRIEEVFAVDARAAFRMLSVPTLYVGGRQDRLIGKRAFDDVEGARPHALVRLIDAPHLLLQRCPDEAAALILAFAASTMASSRQETLSQR